MGQKQAKVILDDGLGYRLRDSIANAGYVTKYLSPEFQVEECVDIYKIEERRTFFSLFRLQITFHIGRLIFNVPDADEAGFILQAKESHLKELENLAGVICKEYHVNVRMERTVHIKHIYNALQR